MYKMVKRVIKAAFRSLGLEVTKAKNIYGNNLDIIGEFIDSKGYKFHLLKGYRRMLWGFDWEGMNKDRSVPSTETVRKLGYIRKGRDQVADLVHFLSIYGLKVEGRDVLEVGCFDGAASYALMEAGARCVHGIDHARGFIPSENPTDAEITQQRDWLQALRDSVCLEFKRNSKACKPERVMFSDQDISNFIETNKYDLLVSTVTLEHILNPRKAFKAMFDALRPGGISFHNYHPFFCTSGAHFDTCDFPWGHVRLNNDDFRQYIRTFRPNEIDISEYRFFRTINRLTLTDLKEIALNTGFKVVDFYVSVDNWHDVTPVIYAQSKST